MFSLSKHILKAVWNSQDGHYQFIFILGLVAQVASFIVLLPVGFFLAVGAAMLAGGLIGVASYYFFDVDSYLKALTGMSLDELKSELDNAE